MEFKRSKSKSKVFVSFTRSFQILKKRQKNLDYERNSQVRKLPVSFTIYYHCSFHSYVMIWKFIYWIFRGEHRGTSFCSPARNKSS